jgi:hypothetical protein
MIIHDTFRLVNRKYKSYCCLSWFFSSFSMFSRFLLRLGKLYLYVRGKFPSSVRLSLLFYDAGEIVTNCTSCIQDVSRTFINYGRRRPCIYEICWWKKIVEYLSYKLEKTFVFIVKAKSFACLISWIHVDAYQSMYPCRVKQLRDIKWIHVSFE